MPDGKLDWTYYDSFTAQRQLLEVLSDLDIIHVATELEALRRLYLQTFK